MCKGTAIFVEVRPALTQEGAPLSRETRNHTWCMDSEFCSSSSRPHASSCLVATTWWYSSCTWPYASSRFVGSLLQRVRSGGLPPFLSPRGPPPLVVEKPRAYPCLCVFVASELIPQYHPKHRENLWVVLKKTAVLASPTTNQKHHTFAL